MSSLPANETPNCASKTVLNYLNEQHCQMRGSSDVDDIVNGKKTAADSVKENNSSPIGSPAFHPTFARLPKVDLHSRSRPFLPLNEGLDSRVSNVLVACEVTKFMQWATQHSFKALRLRITGRKPQKPVPGPTALGLREAMKHMRLRS